jgi:acetyl esterase/lipase
MNLKVMSVLVPGMRYSSHAAPAAPEEPGGRLVVDLGRQIPRRRSGITAQPGLTFRDPLRLDLLTPAAPGRYPLVVYLPGGGFVMAHRGMARPERGFVAAAGYAVASIEYRTIRHGATYRDGVADGRAAIDHLVGQADAYGIDANRIAVWGESAGGYLASLIGLSDPRVQAVVDQFGASDLSRVADGFDARMRAALAHPRHPIHRYGATNANLIDLVRPGAPAFLLLHGDDDRVIPPGQTLALHQALKAVGVDSTHYLLVGAGHGRLALARRQARQWTTVQLMTLITDFLDEHLRS